MKKNNSLIFVAICFLLSTSFYSCSSRKIGFFNNHYQRYEVKKQDTPEPISSSLKETPSVEKKSSVRNQQSITSEFKVKEEALGGMPSEAKPGKTVKSSVTKEERKAIKQHIKALVKESKSNDTGVNTLLLVIIAILLPPVAVALVDGFHGPFWLDILLTLLFYLPGLIYALYRIFR